jgi:hypothetical protein
VHRFSGDPVELDETTQILRMNFTIPSVVKPPARPAVGGMVAVFSIMFGDNQYAQSQKYDVIDLSQPKLKPADVPGRGLFKACQRKGMLVQRNLIPNPTFHNTDNGPPWRMAIAPVFKSWKEKWATQVTWATANAAWDEAGARLGDEVCVIVNQQLGDYIHGTSRSLDQMIAPFGVKICHKYPPPPCGWDWEGRKATTVYGINPEKTISKAFETGPVPCSGSPSVPISTAGILPLVLHNAKVDYCLGGIVALTEAPGSAGTNPNRLVQLVNGETYTATVEARMAAGRRKVRIVADLYHNDNANVSRTTTKYSVQPGPWVELSLIEEKLLSVQFTMEPPLGFPQSSVWVHFRLEFEDRGDNTAAPRDAFYVDENIIIKSNNPAQTYHGASAGMVLGPSARKFVVDSGQVMVGHPAVAASAGTPLEIWPIVSFHKEGGAKVCQLPPEPLGYVAGDEYHLSGKVIIANNKGFMHPLRWSNAGLVFGEWNKIPPANMSWADAALQAWDVLGIAPLFLIAYDAAGNPLKIIYLGMVNDAEWFTINQTFTVPAGTVKVGIANGPGQSESPINRNIVTTTIDPTEMHWKMDSFMLEHRFPDDPPFSHNPWRFPYLDGYTEMPGRAPWITVPHGGKWELGWCGTPYCSSSYLRAPAVLKWCLPQVQVSSVAGAASQGINCVAVHLVDPVLPHVGAWAAFQAMDSWELPSRLELISVIHRYTPVAISDLRESRKGSITLITNTLDQRSRMYRMLNYGRTLLLQFSRTKNWGETALYVAVENVKESYLGEDMSRPERRWELPFQVVNRPPGLISAAVRVTWDEVAHASVWADWTGVLFKIPDWEDLVFNDFDDPYNEEVPSPISGGVFPVDLQSSGVLVPNNVKQEIQARQQALSSGPQRQDTLRAIGPGTP